MTRPPTPAPASPERGNFSSLTCINAGSRPGASLESSCGDPKGAAIGKRQAMHRNLRAGAICGAIVFFALAASAFGLANNARPSRLGAPKALTAFAPAAATLAPTSGLVMTARAASPEPGATTSAPESSGWPAPCAAYQRIVQLCAERLAPSNPARARRLQASIDSLSVDWMTALAQHREITVNGMECTTALILFTRVEAPVRGCGADDLPLPPPPTASLPVECQQFLQRIQLCQDRYKTQRPSAVADLDTMLTQKRDQISDTINGTDLYSGPNDLANLPHSCALMSTSFASDMRNRALDC